MSNKDDLNARNPEDDIGQKLVSGLNIFANVGIKLGKSIDEQVFELRKRNNELQKNTPSEYRIQDNKAFPASGNLLLNLGKPDQGTFWEVSQIVIGGLDLNIAAAGTAGAYVTGTSGVTGGLPNVEDYASSLPNVGFYSPHQMTVNSGEYLLVIVFGGTAGQVYVAKAKAVVYNVAAAGGRTVTID